MTDIDFVPKKLHQPNKFAFLSDLRRKITLGLRGFAAPRALTSGAPHPRFHEQGNSSANLWRKANNRALALNAPLRFALSLEGPFTLHGELQGDMAD